MHAYGLTCACIIITRVELYVMNHTHIHVYMYTVHM